MVSNTRWQTDEMLVSSEIILRFNGLVFMVILLDQDRGLLWIGPANQRAAEKKREASQV